MNMSVEILKTLTQNNDFKCKIKNHEIEFRVGNEISKLPIFQEPMKIIGEISGLILKDDDLKNHCKKIEFRTDIPRRVINVKPNSNLFLVPELLQNKPLDDYSFVIKESRLDIVQDNTIKYSFYFGKEPLKFFNELTTYLSESGVTITVEYS